MVKYATILKCSRSEDDVLTCNYFTKTDIFLFIFVHLKQRDAENLPFSIKKLEQEKLFAFLNFAAHFRLHRQSYLHYKSFLKGLNSMYGIFFSYLQNLVGLK